MFSFPVGPINRLDPGHHFPEARFWPITDVDGSVAADSLQHKELGAEGACKQPVAVLIFSVRALILRRE
jgi:hypothetical protein